MTRQDHVLRTTTLERMLLALVLTTLAIGARPSSADSLEGQFPVVRDKAASFDANGTLIARDAAPASGILLSYSLLEGPLNKAKWY
ncbi:MAG: hypothetical protein IIC21_02155, partial [Chloroflexi bacterium]|nr:hypothetical protein [Chloroflexota bacterium]